MKAAVHTKYGPPEVVTLKNVERPNPKENEILVKVIAATVNRTDSGFRSAEYFVSRFWSGLFRPRYRILGCEFAGIIEATGNKVSEFKVGDKVFGYNDKTFGCHAEYLVIDEKEAVTTLPYNLDFHEAAPIAEGAHYALNNIRAAKIKPEQKVLVYGATGAIGSSAVQLLKYFGAEVTAVCNTKNTSLVKLLGADKVIDYQKQDFTKTEDRFDFFFDAVGKSSFGQSKPLMTENGIYISTELGKNAENIYYALTTPLFKGKKVLFPIPAITKKDINFLKELAEKGVFKPVIDRQYKLDDIVEAYRYVETGQKTGNVVITIE